MAAQGGIAAQLFLAYRYRDGKGVKKDYAETMRWAHLAADRGDAKAMDFVGWMYFAGLGVKRNTAIGAGYFKAAVEKSAQAAWNLGQCYFGAQGVDHDVPRALGIWKKAAEMGHGRAAPTAAMVYLAGECVAADAAEARKLAERAAELNDPSGLVVLGEIRFQASEFEEARAYWTRVSQMKPVGRTGQCSPQGRNADRQGQLLPQLCQGCSGELRHDLPQPLSLILQSRLASHVTLQWLNMPQLSSLLNQFVDPTAGHAIAPGEFGWPNTGIVIRQNT